MQTRASLRERKAGTGLTGISLTALCGGALAACLLLVATIIIVLAVNGLSYFWQRPVWQIELADGTALLGEIHEREQVPDLTGVESGIDETEDAYRIRLKLGNRDLRGNDFEWIDEDRIVGRSLPTDAIVLERREWGNFYGFADALIRAGERVPRQATGFPDLVERVLSEKREQREEVESFERGPLGDVNYEIEHLRLELRRLELEDLPPAARSERVAEIERQMAARRGEYEQLEAQLVEMRERLDQDSLAVRSIAGRAKEIPIAEIVRLIRPNELGASGKLALYADRVREFLTAEPRNSNTEGGIFPAIFGTVLMVFLMSFAVTPLGVLAAIYLREYAGNNWMIRAVRIAVNNLAGVPSIVFGVFGLGFFVYLIGGTIDQLFYPESLPTPTYGTGGILWASLTLALLTVPVVIVATEEGLAAVPGIVRQGARALGATKFETTARVVVPAAAPGILTGMILAMARAAGEVAPLMIVGMVKLAPDLPVDGRFPFLHFERKFMHLGFHIYDVGFQSPNVEATKPLVFATALLLIGVVTLMNLLAIGIRNHLRKKYASSAV
jgi:phosphate transport system permease protein